MKKWVMVCIDPPFREWTIDKKFHTKFGAKVFLHISKFMGLSGYYEIRKL
jgi:hypothetical protein